MDPGLDHEPYRVHQDVAFPTADLLAAAKAPGLPAHPGSLRRLAVHDAGARFGMPAEFLPQPSSHLAVQPLPGAVDPPPPEVVEDRLPGRELTGEHAPLAAGLQHVEDGVKDLARAVDTRASSSLRCWADSLRRDFLRSSHPICRIALSIATVRGRSVTTRLHPRLRNVGRQYRVAGPRQVNENRAPRMILKPKKPPWSPNTARLKLGLA